MRLKPSLKLLMSASFLFTSVACADLTSAAIKEPGTFSFESKGNCAAILKRSAQGGFLQLLISPDQRKPVQVADDITAIAWVSSNMLAYSVSPMYGKPGVFVVTCGENPQVSRLVAPNNVDSAYPEGADYFEIQSVSKDKIQYYYGADVDKMDVATLRSDRNLRVVKIPQ